MKRAARIVSLASLLACGGAFAQDYPARPVTVIVPFSAGSASDVIARIVLERMAPSFGQRFVVDNRPPRAARWARPRPRERRPTATRS